MLKGNVSAFSRTELELCRLIVNTNKPKLYIDARQWLEHYADTHGDQSSMSLITYLPAARKKFYYAQYRVNRQNIQMVFASLSIFLVAWRVEVGWLIVTGSHSKFTKCAVCEYLKWMIDQTPRTQKDILDALMTRLGNHFDFQSAQRLAIGRIEELCAQSNGKWWLMLIDKMDQNAAWLPTISSLSKSAFFKEGNRVQVSINGSWWFGLQHSPPINTRTMHEECEKGVRNAMLYGL